jgi:cytochrome-b5 reductase
MLQVIQESLKNGEDKTKISLLFGNVTPDDVLVKKELDALAAKHPDRFSVHYTVDRPTPEWKGFGGYVTTDMLQKAGLPTKPEPGVMVFVCGT